MGHFNKIKISNIFNKLVKNKFKTREQREGKKVNDFDYDI